MTGELLCATPFYVRTAEANRLNRWENRGGYTLSVSYADPNAEAVAARFGTVLADISWRWRVAITGARVNEFVSYFFTRDVSRLAPGAALETLWLNDAGGVRGLCNVVRTGRESFLFISDTDDTDWLTHAAALYGVSVRDVTAREGVLALTGPYAGQVLEAAGLEAKLEPLALRKYFWKGLDITLSRFGVGYELWCAADDALIVWDRLVAAGRPFALCPVGQGAMDILELESGIVRPGRDFAPARDGFSPAPSPQSLGLDGLVERERDFNGRAGFLAARASQILAGLLLESETPAPHAALTRNGKSAGRTLGSLTSPSLGRAIALAVLDPAHAMPGIELQLPGAGCRTVALPFLPIPVPIPSGDGKSAS
jgi:aminomethyltransferase